VKRSPWVGILHVAAWALALASPLGEGGRSPEALLVIHCGLLAATVLWFRAAGKGLLASPRWDPLLSAGIVTLAVGCLAAARSATHLYGSLLTLADRAAYLLGLFLLLQIPWSARELRRLRLVWPAVLALMGGVATAIALSSGSRAAFPFESPNYLAALLAFGASLAAVAARESGQARIPALILAGVLLAEVIATGSRGGTIAAALGIGVALLGGRKRFLLGLLSVLLLMAATLATAYWLRFREEKDPFAHERVRIWAAVVHAWSDAPLTGVGPGNLVHRHRPYNFPSEHSFARYGREVRNADSTYLQVIVEEGLLGAAAFAWLLGVLLVSVWRAARRSPLPSLTLLAPFLALMAAALFTDLPRAPALVWAPLVLYAATRLASDDPPGTVEPGRRSLAAWLVLAAAVGTALWGGVLAPYLADRAEGRAEGSSDPMERVRALESAARLNPLSPTAPLELGKMFLVGEPDTVGYVIARGHLERSAHLASSEPAPHRLLGLLHARAHLELFHDIGSRRRAIVSTRRAMELDPFNPFLRVEASSSLERLGLPSEARAALQEAVRLEPYYLEAHLRLAGLLERLGERDAALARIGELEERLAEASTMKADSPYEKALLRLDRGRIEALGARLREKAPRKP
jgi:O-antigen ligase